MTKSSDDAGIFTSLTKRSLETNNDKGNYENFRYHNSRYEAS